MLGPGDLKMTNKMDKTLVAYSLDIKQEIRH